MFYLSAQLEIETIKESAREMEEDLPRHSHLLTYYYYANLLYNCFLRNYHWKIYLSEFNPRTPTWIKKDKQQNKSY